LEVTSVLRNQWGIIGHLLVLVLLPLLLLLSLLC
jgi:hypothetical protein